MSGQTILTVTLVVGVLIWIGELIWLYRQAVEIDEDPFAQVSGAAIFFVLAAPVAIMAPDIVHRVADFWEWLFDQSRFGQQGEATPRVIVNGKTFLLDDERARIGRYPNNDLVLDHPTVSAYHAEIALRPDGRHELMDRESRNGTRINGTPIRSAVLRDGDQITLGAITIHYLVRSTTEQILQDGGLPLQRRRFG